MSFENMNITDPQELAAAKAQVEAYGQRAIEITDELVQSCISNDHHKGGLLVREMYDTPGLLMLVVGLLTTNVVNGINGPLATPEQIGADTSAEPETWQIGVADQLEAANSEQDFEKFAQIAVDAQIKALASDFHDHYRERGHYPDTGSVMRALLILDRLTVIAMGAEALRRLALQEVRKEERG